MKLSCEVIQDLLPLYVEDLVSDDSRRLIEEHLKGCESCRRELQEMRTEIPLPFENDPSPLLKIRSSLRKEKGQAMFLTALITMILGIIFASYVTAPKFYSYSPDRVTISQSENGNMLASFGEGVTGYDIENSGGESGAENIYHLVTWNSIWGEWLGKQIDEPIVLNPNGEEVTAVYYYETDGSSNKYLYGEEVYANGGVIILPRLYFSYYGIIAIILFVLLIGIAFLNKNNQKIRTVASKISLLPFSYLVGHLLIKGIQTSSYSALRDLSAILLVTIPLFLLLLFLYDKKQRSTKNK